MVKRTEGLERNTPEKKEPLFWAYGKSQPWAWGRDVEPINT